MTELLQYTHSNDIFEDAKQIILSARKRAYKAADTSLVMQKWLLNKHRYYAKCNNQQSKRF